MGNVVIVQEILTRWTKASRGGENAVRRNAVPEIARVPVQSSLAENLTLMHHRLSFRERDGFSQPTEEVQINPTMLPLIVGCVTVRYNEEEATATFRYDCRCGGAPDRGWARKTLHLTVNEWGQIVYNGRFNEGWDGPWYYEKKVVNVGLFAQLKPGVFNHQEPTCRFAAMGELL